MAAQRRTAARLSSRWCVSISRVAHGRQVVDLVPLCSRPMKSSSWRFADSSSSRPRLATCAQRHIEHALWGRAPSARQSHEAAFFRCTSEQRNRRRRHAADATPGPGSRAVAFAASGAPRWTGPSPAGSPGRPAGAASRNARRAAPRPLAVDVARILGGNLHLLHHRRAADRPGFHVKQHRWRTCHRPALIRLA